MYSNEKWKNFSKIMIEKLGAECSKCFRTREDHVTLQIHHKVYETGKKPWESPDSDLVVLCSGCHAREHDILEPSSDWILISIDDLEGLYGNCERETSNKKLCNTEIRYAHEIYHPKVGYKTVGSECVEHLTSEDQNTSKRILKERDRFDGKIRTLDRGGNVEEMKWKEYANRYFLELFKNQLDKRIPLSFNFNIYKNKYDYGLKIKINEDFFSFTNNKTKKTNEFVKSKDLSFIKKVAYCVYKFETEKLSGDSIISNFYLNELNALLENT